MSDEKKSWRDIDRQRDRSAHTRSDRPPAPGERRSGERSQRTYRSALDRLFDTGQVGRAFGLAPAPGDRPSAATMAEAVKAAVGADAITQAVDAYLAQHPLPADFDFLSAMLDHRDGARVAEALAALAALLDRGERPKRPRALVARLRAIEEIGEDPEAQASAAALRQRLG